MIFYFSGTGNSLYVAKKLYENNGSQLVDITEAMHEKRFKYNVQEDEKVGFVFPVYFYGLPTVVSEFINKLTIKSESNHYIYSNYMCWIHRKCR